MRFSLLKAPIIIFKLTGMLMTLEIIVTLICCGIFSNLMSALFGIGGGVLMVPILMTILPQLSIQQVAATSLSIVIGTALINLSYFLRQKIKISFKSLILWSIGMLIGVQVGFELSFILPKLAIIIVFVVSMAILAVKTFLSCLKSAPSKTQSMANRPKEQTLSNQAPVATSSTSLQNASSTLEAQSQQQANLSHTVLDKAQSTSLGDKPQSANLVDKPQKLNLQANKALTSFNYEQWIGSFFCTVGGMIAGLTGVGGGSILAPIISQLKSVEHKQIAVYTNYMMVIGGLGSMYSYLTRSTPNLFAGTWQVGYINFSLIGIVLAASFCTSFFSMRLRHVLKAKIANLLLSLLLAFIAVYTLCLGTLS